MNRFIYEINPGWPPQAWIAKMSPSHTNVLVRHGRRVDTHADWFGEVVWDGEYVQGRFDKTDMVFGSACRRVDGTQLVFVGSASTLDRLHSMKIGQDQFVSNSLVCLLAETDSNIDASYQRYPHDFTSIIAGPKANKQLVNSSNGPVELTYFDNLIWDGAKLVRIDKPVFERSRTSFAIYQRFLETAIQAIGDNMRSKDRPNRFEFLGTASTGFDSPTVAAIGKTAGLKRVISIASSRSGQNDSGDKIAKRLGMEAVVVSRDAWQSDDLPEIPFLASDAKGEDVYFAGARAELEGTVLLTGYCGSVWGARSNNYYFLKRTDQSGLSLAEYRLWAGFINIPLPLLGVYQAQDLANLMESDERSRWASGKEYDKPFCRFVLSSADIPDDWYGNEKKAASVLLEDRSCFLSDKSLIDFEDYLNRTIYHSYASRCVWAIRRLFSQTARGSVAVAQNIAWRISRILPLAPIVRISKSLRMSEYANGEPEFAKLFPWAIEHAKRRYDMNTHHTDRDGCTN